MLNHLEKGSLCDDTKDTDSFPRLVATPPVEPGVPSISPSKSGKSNALVGGRKHRAKCAVSWRPVCFVCWKTNSGRLHQWKKKSEKP